MRIARTLSVTVPAVLLVAAAAGCSGNGSTDGHADSALRTALGRIESTSATRGYTAFSRQDATLRANGGRSVGPYQRALGLGLGSLGPLSLIASKELGFDPLTIDTAIEAGSAQHAVTLLTGVPSAGVGRKLVALGATKHGTGTYRFAPDNTISENTRLQQALPGLYGFDVVHLDGSQLSYSSAAANLGLAASPAHTLADDPGFSAVGDCLGDPLGAELTDHVPVPAQLTVPPASRHVRAVGVGLSGGRGSTPVETLCVAARSSAGARALESLERTALRSGTSRQSGLPWAQLLRGAKVTRDGTTVALTARSGSSPGVLLSALESGDLPGISG